MQPQTTSRQLHRSAAAIVVVVVVTAVLTWHSAVLRGAPRSSRHGDPDDAGLPADVPARLLPVETPGPATTRPAGHRRRHLTAHDGAWSPRPRSGGALAVPAAAADLHCSPPGTRPLRHQVYRNLRGCGEVTAIDANRGVRRGHSQFRRRRHPRPAIGRRLRPADRSDRLETQLQPRARVEYGRIDARVKPDMGRRDGRGCRLKSGMTAGDRVAVIEHCDGDPGFRLTVIGALLDKEKIPSRLDGDHQHRTAAPVVIAMSDTNIAVYDGGANSPNRFLQRSACSTPTGPKPPLPRPGARHCRWLWCR